MKVKKLLVIGTLSLAALTVTTALAGAATAGVSGGTYGSPAVIRTMNEHKGGCKLNSEIAKILGIDQDTLKSELKSGKTLAQIAVKKGINTNALTQKIQSLMDANIDKAVQSGKLTADKAAKIKATTAQRASAMVNGKWHGNKGPKEILGIRNQISVILGVDASALKTELKGGKSLAEIAQAKGISTTELVKKIKTAVNANIDQAVKEGKISPDQAVKIKTKFTTAKIEQMIQFKHER